MRTFLSFFGSIGACCLLSIFSVSTIAAEASPTPKPSLSSIRLDDIHRHTETLAADAFEGREAGQPGGYAAATYITRFLRQHEIRAAGQRNTFFQPFGRGYRNILAVIPGSDPELAGEHLILSAHYDHVGYGSKGSSNGPIGSIHNGADDNASGVAAGLELAEALKQQQGQLRRSVLIVFWDAEEKGLLGSKHWLANPTVDVISVRLMINVDMIGRMRDRLSLFGTRTMPGLRMAWSRSNPSNELSLDFPWKVINNSDHYQFFQRRIPITMVHTGLHDDYHRPSDDVHRLNTKGIEQTTELLLNFIVDIANRDQLSAFREASLSEGRSEQRYFERPFRHQQRRLGLTVKTRKPGDGLKIDSVWVGSPANMAGLAPGNVVFEANGRPVSSAHDLRQEILRSGETISLKVQSIDGQQVREVKLAGKPQRIGVSWRTNDAEPGVVMLSGIVPGSAADRAGCKPLDRVLKVDGMPVLDGEQFRQLMSEVNETVGLLIERDGMLQQLTLQLSADVE